MKVAIEEVPLDVRRRVAQLLENVRATPMDPTDGKASLTGVVTAIHRPDVDGIAYYEFEVDLGRRAGRRVSTSARDEGPLRRATGAAAQMPARHGFVIAAAGPHDYPVCHFSLDREPPSRQLEIAAEVRGTKVGRVFKLDALSYIGESPDGELAAQTGQMPLPIKGLPADPAKARGQISSTHSQVKGADDKDTEDGPKDNVETRRKGSRPKQVELTAVDGWGELKKVYADSFGPLLLDLAHQAAPAWEIDGLVDKLGEGVLTGTTHRVALLYRDATIEVSGDGADLVEVTLDERESGAGAVALHVADERLDQEVSFDLHIVYGNGMRENLGFFAVSPTTPSNEKPDGGMQMFEESN